MNSSLFSRRRFPCLAFMIGLLTLAAGCARPPIDAVHPQNPHLARMPSGPQLVIPDQLFPRIEGSVLRLERDSTNTERCAIEVEARAESEPSQALAAHLREQGVTRCTQTECSTDDGQTLPIASVQGLMRMPTPPGNTAHVILARPFGGQTILLTYCPDDHPLMEQEINNLLLTQLRP